MTLTIQDLGALGELLGSVAVLATLIYLALQTRQNTMAIAAQLDAAAISANQRLWLTGITSTELLEALAEDRTVSRTINEERRGRYWLAQVITWQWDHHQARRGLLPTFNEAGVAAAIGNLFTVQRSFGGWWEGAKPSLFPEFVEWVDQIRAKAA